MRASRVLFVLCAVVVAVSLAQGARKRMGRVEMDELLVDLLGVALGVASTIPMAYFLGRVAIGGGRRDLSLGLACAIVPLVAIQAALLVVFLVCPASVLSFGVCSTASFLVAALVEGFVAWRRMGE